VENAEKSTKQILGGISTIIQRIAELRNDYGTEHGKDADFKRLYPQYAKLVVDVIAVIVILFLSVNGETAKLVEHCNFILETRK
jgi:hypothetical protein